MKSNYNRLFAAMLLSAIVGSSIPALAAVAETTVDVTEIDDDNPTIIVTGNPTDWIPKSELTVKISDKTMEGLLYKVDEGEWTPYTGEFKIALDVSRVYTVQAKDVWEDSPEDQKGGVKLHLTTANTLVDKVDPTKPTVPVIKKSVEREFSNEDVVVTIIPGKDLESGVGVTEFSIDGGDWITYTQPLTFTSSVILKSRTINLAGTWSDITTSNVKIDKIIPELTNTGTGYNTSPSERNRRYISKETSIYATASDGYSGVDHIEWCLTIDPGTVKNTDWVNWSNVRIINPSEFKEGEYQLLLRAQDKALNYSKRVSLPVTIDNSDPEYSFSLSNTNWTNAPMEILAKFKDKISGLKSVTLPDGTVLTEEQLNSLFNNKKISIKNKE